VKNLICTVIALNYIPQAMALRDSIEKFHPDLEFCVLIIDSKHRNHPYLKDSKIVLVEDLDIEESALSEMFDYYDTVELSTALKPSFLKYLLKLNADVVTYLDPDTVLYSSIEIGFEEAIKHGIVICPHRLTPSNVYNSDFFELSLLKFGVFNLGYISVTRKANLMLDWWEERLRWFSSRYPNEVWFTDQKWIDLVPALFECKILKHSGYDVAPWNINERLISNAKGIIYSGKDPLIFIHFSQMSFDLAQGRPTRHWNNALEELPSDLSLATQTFINEQTTLYSAKLIKYTKELKAIGDMENSRITANGLSFHARRKIILGNLQARRGIERGGVHMWRRWRPRVFNVLAQLLERSSSLNGLRDGFQKDLFRLKLKKDIKGCKFDS
jgi:hypothetical protein